MKMSLKVLFVSVIGFWSVSASANNLGILAGVNLSSVSTNPASTNLSSSTKLTFGVYYEMKLGDWFYFEPGLQYVGAGTGFTTTTDKLSADTIAIPLLAKAKFATGSMVSPFIVAGLTPSFKIGESQTNVTSPSNFKSFNTQLTFGGGAEFEVSPGFAVEVRGLYNLGIINVGSTASFGTVTVKASGFQILGGVAFAI